MVVRALRKKWEPLLLRAKATVYSDHQALEHLTSLEKNRAIQGRAALTEFAS